MHRKKKRLLITGIVFLFLSVFFLLFKSNIFIVKSIVFDPSNLSCADYNQLGSSTDLIGQNIFFINFKKLESNLKNRFLCVKNLTGSSNFLNKIKIQIQERKAVVILFEKASLASSSAILKEFIEASSSSKLNFPGEVKENFFVDLEGVVYAKAVTNSSVPSIYVYGQNLSLGEKIGEDIMNSLIILEKSRTYKLNITEAGILEGVLMINTSPKIIFRLNKDIKPQIASLQLILEKAKMDSEQLEFIDLRFDKPIVRIAPKKNG